MFFIVVFKGWLACDWGIEVLIGEEGCPGESLSAPGSFGQVFLSPVLAVAWPSQRPLKGLSDVLITNTPTVTHYLLLHMPSASTPPAFIFVFNLTFIQVEIALNKYNMKIQEMSLNPYIMSWFNLSGQKYCLTYEVLLKFCDFFLFSVMNSCCTIIQIVPRIWI